MNNLIGALLDIRSFANEIRTKEMRADAVDGMVKILKRGFLVELTLLEGKELCDTLADCFAFMDDECAMFMADVMDDALIIYSNDTGKDLGQVRRQLVNGLANSSRQKQGLSGVKMAIQFFHGNHHAFQKVA